MDRRLFLKIVGIVGGGALMPFQPAFAQSYAIPLGKVEKLKTVGEYMVVGIKGRNVLLIRDTTDTILAYDAACPHKQCVVAYSKERNRIICPCHQSTFDLAGNFLAGPAPKSLTRFDARIAEERIVLTFDESAR